MGNIDAVFLKLLYMSLTACLLVLVVMLLRLVLKNAPKWSRCMMWAVVALRLVCPFTLESALSLIPSAEQIPVEVTYAGEAATQSGISFADGTATLILPQSLAPNPMGSINPMQVVLYIAALLWLLGMAGMLIYMAVSFLRVKRKVREAVVVEGNILRCDHVSSPFILGMIRPKIYLPSGMNEEDVVHVLAHERAHLKRRDHWWKPLGFLILTVHWFNPLVWVAYVLLCRDIELACDEKVIRDMGEEGKKPYSNALINCAAQRRSIAACPLAFGEVGVKGRIKSVLNYKKPIFWVVWLAVAACVALAVCFLTDPKTDNSELEEFLEEQILEYHQSKDSADHICCTDYEILGTRKSGNRNIMYLCVYYAEYDKETGEEVSGSHMPAAITVEGSNGVYGVYEYWTPQYGSLYASSIREKFPFYLWGRALDTQICLEEHRQSCEEQLHKHTADGAELERLRKTYPEYFGLNASKGLDVYVWQMAANSYSFALFPHTNSERDMSELIFVPGTRAEEMRLILSTYDVEEDKICVIPWQNPISSYIGDYWIIREGEDVEAKRERYAERMRNILFGNGTAAGETQDYSDPFYIGTQEGETEYFTTYVIDTATADMDGDGITEEWVLSYGPTSGLYTIRISVSENGRQEYFNIVMPSYIVEGFEKTSDGTLWIEGRVEDHAPSVRIDISIEGEDIVLIENGNEQVRYWGEQGVQSPYSGVVYSSPIEHTDIYVYQAPNEMTAPNDAALVLARQYLKDLMQPSQKRSFQITDYKDLDVELRSIPDMDEETARIYALQPSEIDERAWIVEIKVKFQYEGTISPIGSAEGQWIDELYQSSPVGFLLIQNGSEYTMQSRYLTVNGRVAEGLNLTESLRNADEVYMMFPDGCRVVDMKDLA